VFPVSFPKRVRQGFIDVMPGMARRRRSFWGGGDAVAPGRAEGIV